MLQINMADVVNVIKSLVPYLVVIGALFVAAIIISVAVNKKTVKNEGTRKLVRSETWLVALIAIVAAVSAMMSGPLSTLLNNATAKKYELQSSTVSRANKLAEDIQDESVVMLQNDDSNLPLASKKVNVFGWGSTNPVYGGTGSGSMSKQYPMVSMLEGMKNAGLTTNARLTKLYTDYRKDRPDVSMFKQDWTLPELPAKNYTPAVMNQAKSFSDQAVVVISRIGGEGADLPRNMKAKDVTYKDNSKDYPDFQEGQSLLQIDKTEQDMLDTVTKNFENVTLVYNGANTLQFDFLNKYPQIKSVLWCPPAGQTGFTSLGKVLAGSINPSGKTSDTFLTDLKKGNTYNNSGDFKYDNVEEFKQMVTGFTGETYPVKPTFVNYTEGIYMGYKFYETAAKEGLINYADYVKYPFGYGLSYTKFNQKMGEVSRKDGRISFDVMVTNTGTKAGKDTVEVYYNPPYTNGGIEKASANLVKFEKSKLLKPGETQAVKVSFKEDEMASYDEKGVKSYVLEGGDYDVSINSDSHTVLDHKNVSIHSTITYNSKSNTHNGDKAVATNRFDDARGDVTYLSRANHFANYEQANAAPSNFSMSDKAKSEFTNLGNYKDKIKESPSDKMPTTGAKNNVKLADLHGKSYNDPQWDKLLDEMSVKDMDNLIANGGYGTVAVPSVGKVQMTDADGPAALNNNFTKVGSIGFPSSTSVACTWNKELATKFGELIGDMAHDMNVGGWYAPSQDIHRSPFSGRNFEYFSEDATLSGTIAAGQIAGAESKGVYAFMKHFALNDQETNRMNMLCTWADEQAIREIYLKSFEMSVKQGHASAAMSAFNYIGPTWCGANPALLKSVLRDEWGFKGFVLTDYFSGAGFMNADQAIRAGNDAMLATTKTSNHVNGESASTVLAMRQASKNILYAAANSWLYEHGEPKAAVPIWRTAMYVLWVLAALLFVLLEYVAIRRFMRRRKASKVEAEANATIQPVGVNESVVSQSDSSVPRR
ncbi:glycoside hydrolase family 3 protein [Bifidobacterium bombi]|uniref:Beta-glucosidase-related glycosidase n=1 Tax=Bifidobacterium bombi DSM 19703 TaxID=1341695 RepID=A0A080N5M4_9BIFI|nr:glycoside hydrolase family 3 protein [Bifidobacterium bombi]KFF30794.1 beta-glucosidase-related glycosidase [Bifidobacterium bombi DSM 19703]